MSLYYSLWNNIASYNLILRPAIRIAQYDCYIASCELILCLGISY